MNPIIRKMCENDLHPLYELLSNPKVMTYLEPPYSLSQTESFLRDAGLSDSPLVYAVTENGKFIGYVIYHEYYDNNIVENAMETGWVLLPEYWGCGYASQLTDIIIEKAQHEKKNLVIECVPEQEVTEHMALKKGFKYIGNYDGLDVFIRRFS